jgi:MFS family permease
MLRHLYPDERLRDRAVGIWTAVCGLALALGPAIGGVLTGIWDWQAIFWFNLAFGAAALGLGTLALPESADPDAHRVDIAGTVLGAVALSALVFAVISAETAGFAAPDVIALLCVSAVAGVLFGRQERRAAHPLLDLRYLRVPQFLTANVVALCAYFATFAVFFFTALYLAEVAGYSGYQIALIFLPMTALMTLTSVLAGRWTVTAGSRWSVVIGCVVFGVGLLLTAVTISPSPRFAQLAAALAVTGIGVGATVVPITSAALSAVPPERSGMAASAANTSREIGAVLGVAVLGALVNSQLHADLTSRLRQLGIPANFQAIVINAIETGTVPRTARPPAREAPRARARPSSCRTSSTPPTPPSTQDCRQRCSSRPGSSWPPGCSPSSCSRSQAHCPVTPATRCLQTPPPPAEVDDRPLGHRTRPFGTFTPAGRDGS